MAKIKTYSYTGRKVADSIVPAAWKGKVNKVLLAQALHVYRDRKHLGLSKTKTRGDLNYTTRKMYAQKGTGNARHGAKSAPIFAGGGTAHGPKGIKKVLNLPKKMRKAALTSSFVAKMDAKRIVIVKGLEKIKKTSDAAKLIDAVLKDLGHRSKFVLALSKDNQDVAQFARNLKNVKACLYKNLNAYTVYTGGTVLVDETVFTKPKKQKNPVNQSGKSANNSPSLKVTKGQLRA